MDTEITNYQAKALNLLDGANYDLAAGEMEVFLKKMIQAINAVHVLATIVLEDRVCHEKYDEFIDSIYEIYENLTAGNIRAAENKIPEARKIESVLYNLALYLPEGVDDSESESDSDTDSDFDSGSEDEDPYPEMY